MRILLFLLLLGAQLCFTQNVKFLDSIPLEADTFIGVDEFEDYYYTQGNTLYKKTKNKTYAYTNTQLGAITLVDATNPLKILVFYSGFNTIVLLDNRLNEFIAKIDLNNQNFAKNVVFAGISSNDNLWLYSNDDKVLSLWNYKTQKTIFETQPLGFYVTDFEAVSFLSNYKYCWVMNHQTTLKFNEFGSFMALVPHGKEQLFHPFDKGYVLVQDSKFYYQEPDKDLLELSFKPPKNTDNLVISNGKIYFFNSNMLYKYEVLKK